MYTHTHIISVVKIEEGKKFVNLLAFYNFIKYMRYFISFSVNLYCSKYIFLKFCISRV